MASRYIASPMKLPTGHDKMPPEQKALFKELRSLFDRSTEKGSNPISKLGAMMSDQDTIKHYQTPLNALGIHFPDDYLADGATKPETNMLREAGVSPISARGKIAIGPEAIQGQKIAADTIHHELAHKAISALDPTLTGGLNEIIVRALMINEGRNVEQNKQWLATGVNWKDPKAKEANIKAALDLAETFIKDLSKKAKEKLKEHIKPLTKAERRYGAK